jgi:multidrug transporter EmrE-like cation transporter
MSLLQIIGLSLVEIVGDYGLKQYANDKGIGFLGVGVAGYIGVLWALIMSLQGSTLLLVNSAWDGISTILESSFAFFILGERFDNYFQYLGVVLIIVGLFLLKIPLQKSHPFHIPK